MKSTGNKTFDRALRRLARAQVRLDSKGPDRATRNRALGALRALRACVDAHPVPITRRKARRLTTYEGRRDRLLAAGWCAVRDIGFVKHFAAAGVPVRKVEAPSVRSSVPAPVTGFFVPAWAAAIGHDKPSALRKANGNLAEQRVALAAAALAKV